MTDLPIVQFSLETPAGYIVGPAEAISLGATVAVGTNMLYYRFGLPLLGGGKPAHGGVWHAVLEIGKQETRAFLARERGNGARYSVSVHTYSNVRMTASLNQSNFEPGATLVVGATLTEFGIPLSGTCKVEAELRRPDGTQTTIILTEVEPGVFQTEVVASLAGIYQFHLLANGWTHRGEAFTREQILTGLTSVGGNLLSPTTPQADHKEDLFCCLLISLLKNEVFRRFLTQHEMDPAILERCVSTCCDRRNTPSSDRELAELEGIILPPTAGIANLSGLLDRPDFLDILRQFIDKVG